ncbi:MAG: ribonuclease E activity regulator RraA [Chromatiales bacterium]
MSFATADLYDQHEHRLQVLEPILSDYGGQRRFSGPIATVKVFEDNSLVRAALEEPGGGKVLVVDGGGSLRCALVGDKLAELAGRNGWAGLVVYGCIRDAAAIAKIPIGLKAVNTTPRKSVKQGAGDRDIPVQFAGVTFTPDWFLYADEDGVLISEQPLA